MRFLPILALSAMSLSATAKTSPPAAKPFGHMPDGNPVTLYSLTNKHGLVAEVSDLGATLVAMKIPDRNGQVADVLHGFDSAAGYLGDTNPYFGGTVGRFGNRIAGGRFTLDGKKYKLATNNEPGGIPCHLHGGKIGFNRRLWKVTSSTANSIVLQYTSPAGEEGYPGTLTLSVAYALTDKNKLEWTVTATTDAPTIINIVHHPYWNLSGNPSKSINDHLLTIPAAHYLPTTIGLIPTGTKVQVKGTPMDFTKAKVIGSRLDEAFEPLKFAGGYDHCWVLTKAKPHGLARAATLQDPSSGRTMEIFTNQPGIQFYGGNFLDGKLRGKNGTAYGRRTALCLETEGFPDAPNQAAFPSAALRPGEVYHHAMVYKFSAK